jgi:hypothetical protein
VAISAKEILHFGKSGLGFLDILFLIFSAKERGHTCERREKRETGRTCGGVVQ